MIPWFSNSGSRGTLKLTLSRLLLPILIKLQKKSIITTNKGKSRGIKYLFTAPPVLYSFSLFTPSNKKEKVIMTAESDVATVIEEANELYKENKFQEVYDKLIQHKSETSNCELQWKLARAARDLSQLDSTSKDRKLELVSEGLKFAENAVAANDADFSAHKWKGILLSDLSSSEGYKKQIANAYIIRDEFVKAAELNPNDALCQFLMGEWCLKVADMTWIQRQAAKALFGTPPTSSYDEALKYFLKAEDVNSGFYVGTYVSLGKTYLKMKNKEDAKKWLTKAVNYKSENEKDDKLIEEAKGLMKGL